MNVMIITHSYLPSFSPRALRWSAIAEQWVKKGNQVDVLSSSNGSPCLQERVNGVRIYRIEGFFLQRRRGQLGALQGSSGGKFARWLRRLYEVSWKRIYWPDYACLWYYAASRKAKELLGRKRYEVIISVSLPFTNHLVGMWLQKNSKDVPWLVDVGDPFSFSEMRHLNNHVLYRKLNERVEGAVFTRADWVTVTTEEVSSLYKQKFPENAYKMNVIPPLLNEREELNKASAVKLNEGKINISYVGNFYRSIREPDVLLSLLESVLKADPALRETVAFHIFGNTDRFPTAFEKSKELEQVCTLHGSVEHSFVGQIIGQSQMLINLGNTTCYQLPSKIVEYAASGKPIINICTSQSDSSLRFLRNYSLTMNVLMKGKTPLSPIGELVRFIKENYAKQMTEGVLQEFIKPYRGEHISDQYLAVIHNKPAGMS